MGFDETMQAGESIIAQAFSDAGISPDSFAPQEVDEQVDVERPRNADGTFAARDTDPVEAVEVEPVAPDEVEVLRQRLAEKDSLIGKHSNEVGELRRQIEEMRSLVEQPQQVQQPQQQFDPDQLDSWLDQNVAYLPQIAENARQAGHQDVFRAALAKWREYDDFGPMDYLAGVKAQEAAAALQSQIAPLVQPVLDQRRDQALASVVGEVQQKYSDLPVVSSKIGDNPDLVPGFLLSGISSDDPRTQRDALEAVYRWVKQEEAPAVRETVQNIAAETLQQERQEKILATVATGGTPPVGDESPATPQDELISFWQGSWGNGWSTAAK